MLFALLAVSTLRAEESGTIDDFSHGLCDWLVPDPVGVEANPGGDPVIAFPARGPVRLLVISNAVGVVDDFDIAASFAGSGADAANPGHSEHGLVYGHTGDGTEYVARVFPAFPGGAFRLTKVNSGAAVYPGSGDNKDTGVTFNAGNDNSVVRPTALRIRKTGTLFELFAASSSASGWHKFFEFTDSTCLPGYVGFCTNGAPPERVDPVGCRFAMFGEGPAGIAEVLASTDRPLSASYALGSAGAGFDPNGDGLDDLIVSRQPPGGTASFVYHGNGTGLAMPAATVLTAPGGPHFPGQGINCGDLDGDGAAEVVFGLTYANGGTGQVYLYRGSATGLGATPAAVLDPPVAGATPGTTGFNFGSSVAVGDFDGDGLQDLVVGAVGVVYLYLGETGGFASSPVDSLTSPLSPDGSYVTDNFGRWLASVGDLDGDGCADILVASYPFRFHVYRGSASGFDAPALAYEGSSDYLGPQIAAGDFNRDGYSDFAINEIQSSRILVWHGGPGSIPATPSSILSPAGRIYPGSWLACVGDFNGDGFDDLAASDYDNFIDVLPGGPSGISSTPIATYAAPSEPGDYTLTRLAGAGDLNRDGLDDLLVGLPKGNGVARVFFGGRTGSMLTADIEIPWPGPNPAHPDGSGFGSALVAYNPLLRLHRCNEAPTANAGADQSVECAGPGGTEVTLDASGSSDPNGDTLTYVWTGPFGTVTGKIVAVSLAFGGHDITLGVYDGRGGMDTDTVRIEVVDTLPPELADVPGPVVAEQDSVAGATVSLASPTAMDQCAGAIVVASDAPAVFPPGATIVTWSATDPSGLSASATTLVTVVDTTAPVLTGAPGLVVLEQDSPAGAAATLPPPVASDASAGFLPVASDAPAVFPPGVTLVTWTATDAAGNTGSAVTVVMVADTVAPNIQSLSANPAVINKNNHKMVAVTITAAASDAADAAPACRIISVTSNEPVNGAGDGNTAPDWEITGDLTLNVRAERSGQGTGRIYTITVECTDAAGNASSATVTVTVPK
jgi:hypothetical protein